MKEVEVSLIWIQMHLHTLLHKELFHEKLLPTASVPTSIDYGAIPS